MQFPLSKDLDILDKIHDLISSDRFVDLDIKNLTIKDIDTIQRYASLILPYDLFEYNYIIFHDIAAKLDTLYNKFSQYDLIIAPGDSPSKYVLTLKLCGYNFDNILQFPLSGLGSDEGISVQTSNSLNNYIAHLLQPFKDIKTIAIFDYSSTGETIRHLTQAIKLSLGQNIKIKHINTPFFGYSIAGKQHSSLMVEGEILCSRCIKQFDVNELTNGFPTTIIASNIMKCNIICLIVALAFYGKLTKISIPKIKIKQGIYKATYYHACLNMIIKNGLIYIGNFYHNEQQFKPILRPKEYIKSSHNIINIPYLSLIEIHSRVSIEDEELYKYINKIVTAELIDDEIVQIYIRFMDILNL